MKGSFPRAIDKLNKRQMQQMELNSVEADENSNELGSSENEKKSKKRQRSEADDDSLVLDSEVIVDAEIPEEVYSHPQVGYVIDDNGDLILRSPVGVVSHREGVHCNDPINGKPAITTFRLF